MIKLTAGNGSAFYINDWREIATISRVQKGAGARSEIGLHSGTLLLAREDYDTTMRRVSAASDPETVDVLVLHDGTEAEIAVFGGRNRILAVEDIFNSQGPIRSNVFVGRFMYGVIEACAEIFGIENN